MCMLAGFRFEYAMNEMAFFRYSKHFVDILTVVSREVQEMRAGGECMVPIYNSVLRRDIFFPRRLPSK